jgi:hypothetical protein
VHWYHWYFSPALDTPGHTAITLDRMTSDNTGPLDTDIGLVAVGNFDETMRSHGWDRQFRGELRGLQIFGSRIGQGGALTVEAIQTLAPLVSAN